MQLAQTLDRPPLPIRLTQINPSQSRRPVQRQRPMRPRLPEKPIQSLFPNFDGGRRQRPKPGAFRHEPARRFHGCIQPVASAKGRVGLNAVAVSELTLGAQPGLAQALFPGGEEALGP